MSETEPSPTRTPSLDADDSTLWLVSYADEDDRELRASQIAEALRRGEIGGHTIVWREGQGDWMPLEKVPALARLLPNTGETATAPLVATTEQTVTAPIVTKAEETVTAPLVTKAKVTATRPLPAAPKLTTPTAPKAAMPAAPSATKSEGGTPQWKGTTRIGLPKAPPTPAAAQRPHSTTLIAGSVGVPAQPAPAASDDSKSGPKLNVPATSSNIWSDDDDEALSVEPESIGPLSPSPGIARATALSAGTLGLPKRPAPKPPSPKRPPTASSPDIDVDAESGTPALGGLIGATHSGEAERVDEDFMGFGASGGAPVMVADLAAALTSASVEDATGVDIVELPTETGPEPVLEGTPTLPTGEVRKAVTPKASAAAPVAPAPEKKKSAVPFFLAGAIGVVAIVVAMRGTGSQPNADTTPVTAPAATQEPPRAAEPVATPPPTGTTTAEAPSASAAPEPPAQSAPSPSAAAPETAGATHADSKAKAGTVATGVATPKAEPKSEATTPAATPKAPEKAAEPAPAPEPKQVDVGGEFDKGAAVAALGAAATAASGCRKDGDPSGVAEVHVTFANSGHATRATLDGPPFAGTATGGCIVSALRQAKVPPYGGDKVTVTKHIVIH